MPIASLHNVTTHYGAQPVLKGASLEINPGQKLGLIGANGSGKTTILRVLLGHEPVTGGSVYLDPGARLGYVPQHVEHDTGEAVMSWLLGEYKPIADALQVQEASLTRTPAAEMDGALRRYQEVRDGKLVSLDGNFSEFWHARQAVASAMTGRVKTRERGRARARVERAEQRDMIASLERRIKDAEAEKLDLEQQAADAFNLGQHRRGRRTGRQIERNAALLDDLYEQWAAATGI